MNGQLFQAKQEPPVTAALGAWALLTFVLPAGRSGACPGHAAGKHGLLSGSLCCCGDKCK